MAQLPESRLSPSDVGEAVEGGGLKRGVNEGAGAEVLEGREAERREDARAATRGLEGSYRVTPIIQ